MNMKLLVTGLALSASVFAYSAEEADPMGSVTAVGTGFWSSSYQASKDYADRNGIPMLIFWANPPCGQCRLLENALRESAEFSQWAQERQLVMVFGYGTASKDLKACKKFVKNSSGEFPYIGVYYNGALEKFTGRSGKMGHGTEKNSKLEQQFMDAVDNILAGWGWQSGVTPGPSPMPQPQPQPNLDMNEAFGKAKSLKAVVIDRASGNYCGTATISVGKISKTKKTVKVTVKASLFVGKTVSANVTEIPVAKSDKIAAIGVTTLSFKSPLGAMDFALEYDSTTKALVAAAENAQYAIVAEEVVIGGSLGKDKMFFGAELPDELEFPTGYTRLADIHVPFGEPVYIKNGTRFSVDKAAVLKYKKVDGAYVLDGKDDPKKPNLSGLKLTYTSKTGAFKGSFYVYAVKAGAKAGAKPTLKKYSAKISGVVVNGTGYGVVTVKIDKTPYSGLCQLD